MQWRRIPSPGKMSGGNRWVGALRGTEYVIAKAHGKFYLTAAVGFMAAPTSIGAFNSLSDAKSAAERTHNPGPKRHSAQFDRCVRSVKKRLTGVANPYAVCMAALGKKATREHNPLPKPTNAQMTALKRIQAVSGTYYDQFPAGADGHMRARMREAGWIVWSDETKGYQLTEAGRAVLGKKAKR